MPGFDDLMQAAGGFHEDHAGRNAWLPGVSGWGGSGPGRDDEDSGGAASADDLAQIKKQLAELQKKLSKL